MRYISLAFLLYAAATPAFAQDTSGPEELSQLDEAVLVFSNTCMSHFFSKDDLHAKYDNSKSAVRWSGDEAAKFLSGKAGTVWGIRGKTSNYAITLLDTNDICSVSAEHSTESVWSDFDKLLTILFPGTDLAPVSGELAGPTTELIRSKGYRLRSKDKFLPPIFTMTTSRDPNVGFEARITMYFPPQPEWNPPH